jgi:hypothetical protein
VRRGQQADGLQGDRRPGRAAADNPLLKAVLSAAHGGTQDLLPLLAVQAEPVLERALDAVLQEARARYAGLGLTRLPDLIEIVVRLTLSHLMQPSGPVEQAAGQAAWVVRNALAAC